MALVLMLSLLNAVIQEVSSDQQVPALGVCFGQFFNAMFSLPAPTYRVRSHRSDG